jgi:glycosyltransferase involved in cell wall biosynthesis
MLQGLAAELRAVLTGGGRAVYVGVDVKGGMAAALSSAVLRRGFVFVSLELRLPPEQKRGIHGVLARLAYRRAAAALAQGADRFDLMTRELGWRHPTTFTLPNAPFADEAGMDAARDDLFRDRFAIAPGKRIALQAGMINEITCSTALATGFAAAGDWALVLHERFKRSPEEPYLAGLRARNTRNLYLSLDPLPYDQIERVFAGCDIGLAFYQPETPDDDNFRFISSSGKLTHYLKYGKPVLVSDLPPLRQLIDEYRCGLVVKDPADPAEVAAALGEIASRYDEFSRNATRCFAERYDFGKGAEPVILFMAGL